jgi:uncharacterized protein
MTSVAIGIFCKTPTPGLSKTRLSPPLHPNECGAISACFIRDLAATIDDLANGADVTPYAVYMPAGSEEALKVLLPQSFRLLLQHDADFGGRLLRATAELLAAGHAGVVLVNADSPTLPASILRAAADAIRTTDAVVLGPAIDGGYTLIGLSKAHAQLFKDIPWSTSAVYPQTIARAQDIGLPVVTLSCWYDVDDKETLSLLERELTGARVPFATAALKGAPAPATARFLVQRRNPATAGASW